MATFSVVVPVYNVEKYLNECIDSVLSQSFTDFELILVDDGATDTSGAICDEYAKKDSRVLVFHKENGGQSTARNYGVSKASGQYVVFLDSDDFIADVDFFKDIFNRIKENFVDIVAFKYSEYFESTKKISHSSYDYSKIEDTVDINEKIKYLIKQDAFFCSAWSKTVKREILVNNNIVFDENSKCEDMDWYFSVVEKSQTMLLCNKEYVTYRRRENSVTSTFGVKNLKDYLAFFQKWSKKLAEDQDKKTQTLRFAAAKLYFNLLIAYLICKDKQKKTVKRQLKSYSYFLQYNLNPKVEKIRKFKKLFGFNGLLVALKLLLILK
ncbi:MAG: glycosyltransferase family 2 protein [Clostridiales bacterium]|nr:glycosyltransferase family 2 protein [Clostridiales bacterium]